MSRKYQPKNKELANVKVVSSKTFKNPENRNFGLILGFTFTLWDYNKWYTFVYSNPRLNCLLNLIEIWDFFIYK